MSRSAPAVETGDHDTERWWHPPGSGSLIAENDDPRLLENRILLFE